MVTVAFYQMLGLKVSQRLVYRLMQELGIRFRMVSNISKPKTHTEYHQRPNLIKTLVDQHMHSMVATNRIIAYYIA